MNFMVSQHQTVFTFKTTCDGKREHWSSSAEYILKDPTVICHLEVTARGGILRSG
jgi:hypothetical protein